MKKPNVCRIEPVFDKVRSVVFPIESCYRVIQFYSFKWDLVVDLFGSSSTLGVAARRLGRFFFLTEKEEKYVDRMREIFGSGGLFAQDEPNILTLREFQNVGTQT